MVNRSAGSIMFDMRNFDMSLPIVKAIRDGDLAKINRLTLAFRDEILANVHALSIDKSMALTHHMFACLILSLESGHLLVFLYFFKTYLSNSNSIAALTTPASLIYEHPAFLALITRPDFDLSLIPGTFNPRFCDSAGKLSLIAVLNQERHVAKLAFREILKHKPDSLREEDRGILISVLKDGLVSWTFDEEFDLEMELLELISVHCHVVWDKQWFELIHSRITSEIFWGEHLNQDASFQNLLIVRRVVRDKCSANLIRESKNPASYFFSLPRDVIDIVEDMAVGAKTQARL